MSGAQVVPILAYSNETYIANLLPKLNGVLFPGGGVEFDIKNRWTSNANYILQYAIQQNDKGNVFPIWGTCLGHQLLGFLTNNFQSPLSAIRGQTAVLNTIKFPNADKGTLFSDMSAQLMTKLTTGQGITYFNHHWAITSETYANNKRLNDFWKLIGETTSSYNEKFVSVWEARKYPFFGVQFHPEKAIF
jgi:gamma-glutamyl hydrolase